MHCIEFASSGKNFTINRIRDCDRMNMTIRRLLASNHVTISDWGSWSQLVELVARTRYTFISITVYPLEKSTIITSRFFKVPYINFSSEADAEHELYLPRYLFAYINNYLFPKHYTYKSYTNGDIVTMARTLKVRNNIQVQYYTGIELYTNRGVNSDSIRYYTFLFKSPVGPFIAKYRDQLYSRKSEVLY